ncbi:PHD-finger domain-containing protein [Ditylenchus destructor]|nr:PHD-finger domain-containing protein [Ditylenchus destructor]
MISDATYIEIMKNCSKWNSRTLNGKTRSEITVFDQQTGVVHKPTDHLFRSYTERIKPKNPMQVVAYPAERWVKPSYISSDAVEMKYFLTVNPSLNDAIISLTNPGGPSAAAIEINSGSQETSSASGTPMRAAAASAGKYEVNDIDISEYDMEELDNDPSDEDDWGSSRRKRKKPNPGGSAAKPKGRPTNTASNGGNSLLSTPSNSANTRSDNSEPRPFVCQICGAKYKSRPGLTYHRIHVHQDEQAPKSPIISPSLQVSDTCDFCLGNKLKNAQGKAEELVTCHDCGRSGHPSCLNLTANAVISIKKHGWQCLECKSCTICGTSVNDHQLMFCDDCDRGFHCYCLKPPLPTPPDGSWSCDLCKTVYGKSASIFNPQKAVSSES